MAGNALGRLYIKLAEDADAQTSDQQGIPLPMGGPGSVPSFTSGSWGTGPLQGNTTPAGMAGQLGAMIDPDIGKAIQVVTQALTVAKMAPSWATQYIQMAPGPKAELAQQIQQQTGIVSMTAARSLGAELRKALSGEAQGAGAEILKKLLGAVPTEQGQAFVKQLQSFASGPDHNQADLVIGMIAAPVAQELPQLGQLISGFFPNVITNAAPLRDAYMASHNGRFDPQGFEQFVQQFTQHVDAGTFARKDANGEVQPGSMNAQYAASLAAFAAEHAPQGISPGQLIGATANVSKSLNNIMDVVAARGGKYIDIQTAMALLQASPDAGAAVTNPNAAAQFAAQIGDISRQAGIEVSELASQAQLARRQGINPAVALQNLAQSTLVRGQIGRDENLQRLPTTLRDRLAAGFGQAATTGTHTSDNLKMLAAAADMSQGFATSLKDAFARGDTAKVSALIQQAKSMPNAWARYKTTDTSYVEQFMADAGPNASKAFLGAEVGDLVKRTMTPELSRMSDKEILERLKPGGIGTQGLSNQAAALFRKPEFITSLMYSRGMLDPRQVPRSANNVSRLPEAQLPAAKPPPAPQGQAAKPAVQAAPAPVATSVPPAEAVPTKPPVQPAPGQPPKP